MEPRTPSEPPTEGAEGSGLASGPSAPAWVPGALLALGGLLLGLALAGGVEGSAQPLLGAGGLALLVTGTTMGSRERQRAQEGSRDSTRRVQASLEELLRRSEARARATFEAIPEAIYRMNAAGTLMDLKALARGGLSAPSAEQQSITLTRLVGEAAAPAMIAARARSLETRAPVVLRFMARPPGAPEDADPRTYEARVASADDGEVLAFVRDVTSEARLEELKQQFLASVSHELRTPLAATHGALRLLQDTLAERKGEVEGELLDIALANAHRLSTLVEDLIDLERMDGAGLSLRLGATSMRRVAEETIGALRGLARSAGVTIALEATADPPLRADAGRVSQVLTNLLSNALKFAPRDSQVRVTIEVTAEDRVRVAVVDRGPGISPEDQGKLFRRWSQVATASGKVPKGSGIGLSVSRGIVESHGGRIGITSARGQGSTFWFELPLDGPPAPAVARRET